MAKRKRRNRRRRKGRFAFLYRLVCVLLILGAVGTALAVFFKADHIEITGNSRYTTEEIVAAGGVAQGDNLYLLNKYDIAKKLTGTLPYIESVRIYRKLPDTLCMEVRECTDMVSIEQDGKRWLMCHTGKILEGTEPDAAADCAVVTGLILTDPQPGLAAAAVPENDLALQQLLQLLQQLQKKGMLGDVQAIRLEDPHVITLRYLDRFNVELPWDSDFDYKLNFLSAVVGKLEEYEKGTLKLTEDGEAHFIMQ